MCHTRKDNQNGLRNECSSFGSILQKYMLYFVMRFTRNLVHFLENLGKILKSPKIPNSVKGL